MNPRARLLLAVGCCGGVVALALFVGAPLRAVPERDVGPGASAFPDYPGAATLELAGSLTVNGSRVRPGLFRTPDDPAKVIEHYLARFAPLPVDVLVEELENGQLLSVFDNHQARHLVVSARRIGEETEVVLSETSLGARESEELSGDSLPLPRELTIVQELGDSFGGAQVKTRTGLVERGVAETVALFDQRFADAAFVRTIHAVDPQRPALTATGRTYTRGGREVSVVFVGDDEGTLVTLRSGP